MNAVKGIFSKKRKRFLLGHQEVLRLTEDGAKNRNPIAQRPKAENQKKSNVGFGKDKCKVWFE